jgi:maleylacetate reductase
VSEPEIAAGLSALGGVLERLGARRVLLVTGPSERFLDRVRPALAGRPFSVFNGARRHVPEAVLEAAEVALKESGADTLVALGGGGAIGVAKALRLSHDLRFVAIPTTYAGSERTSLYGTTSSAGKKTGRDPRVRPDAVIYDLELTLDMPKVLTVQSLMNSLAHPLSALSTRSLTGDARNVGMTALQTLYPALGTLANDPENRAAREAALNGAGLAARAIEAGKPGTHHELAHALGGLFDLDHGGLHSVLLPHSVHELRVADPEVLREIEARLGTSDLEGRLFDVLARAGAPTSVKQLGVTPEKLDELLPKMPETTRAVLQNAYHGRRPSSSARRD